MNVSETITTITSLLIAAGTFITVIKTVISSEKKIRADIEKLDGKVDINGRDIALMSMRDESLSLADRIDAAARYEKSNILSPSDKIYIANLKERYTAELKKENGAEA